MNTIKLNSNILPIISVGMYETWLDPRYMFDDYTIDDDFNEGSSEYNAEQFWDNYDDAAYVKHIAKLAKDFIDGEYTSGDITVKVSAGEIYSPQYYNFATDEIDLTVDFDKAKLLEYAHKYSGEFNAFLKKHYSSYDGFISFTANNFTEWLVAFEEDKAQEVAAILYFWFEQEQIEFGDGVTSSSFDDYVRENTFYSEFYKQPEEK